MEIFRWTRNMNESITKLCTNLRFSFRLLKIKYSFSISSLFRLYFTCLFVAYENFNIFFISFTSVSEISMQYVFSFTNLADFVFENYIDMKLNKGRRQFFRIVDLNRFFKSKKRRWKQFQPIIRATSSHCVSLTNYNEIKASSRMFSSDRFCQIKMNLERFIIKNLFKR